MRGGGLRESVAHQRHALPVAPGEEDMRENFMEETTRSLMRLA